jgi:hypothetical protein
MSEELKSVMAEDIEIAKTANAKYGEGGRLKGGEGFNVRNVSMDAVMNAVNTEGPEVMSAAGKGYWDDMARKYPWLQRAGGSSRKVCRRDGKLISRSRFGKGIVVGVY